MTFRGPARVVEAGDSALLLELGPRRVAGDPEAFDVDVNLQAIGTASFVRAQRIPGVRDVVPTYRSVAAFFDPLVADVEAVRAALETPVAVSADNRIGRTREVPVCYGGEFGPDLAEVAAFARCDEDAVVARHTTPVYRVFMIGFLPGYPYMAAVDASIAAPRKAAPRTRVAAGSVGIAGRQTGIYPVDSPGGWQIIGRTPLVLFDPEREPPALLMPGDLVRFVRTESWPGTRQESHAASHDGTTVSVVRPGLLTTVQDLGRWGYQHHGVSPSGAMDRVAHRAANLSVGNPVEGATLEATLVGPELQFLRASRIAVAGADLSAQLDGADLPLLTARDCVAGSVLRFGGRRSGARAYIAFAGGIDARPRLGSRATHLQSRLGGFDGRMLRAGDRLSVGRASGANPLRSRGEPHEARPTGAIAPPSGGARLRILPGPQADFFDPATLRLLERSRFTVSPQSDRMGYRLAGVRIPVARAGEMISDVTVAGALQVPPSGDPILLMADRQTTGGYPQLAVVITADLPLAAQLLPGEWVEFERCSRSEALAALVAQEEKLRALG